MVHLMKLAEVRIMWRAMRELLSNYELERTWKEAVVALFEEPRNPIFAWRLIIVIIIIIITSRIR
jgi:hypothetical protein